jgi:hypothetical protein
MQRISLAAIMASAQYANQNVMLHGRCLGAEPGKVAGPPPSRSAWVFESEGASIYVTGKFPGDCTLTQAGSADFELHALVVQDTVTVPGQEQRRARRFLARLD